MLKQFAKMGFSEFNIPAGETDFDLNDFHVLWNRWQDTRSWQ